MAKSGNQKGKLLYLAEIFHRETDEAHGLTLAELTERLAAYGVQAERKTLYADMEELRRCGLDIDSWKEERGSRSVSSTFRGRLRRRKRCAGTAGGTASAHGICGGTTRTTTSLPTTPRRTG